MTRLHVLLGAGGVGKTTLAAGYALALAQQGRRVGLLGTDPSRRLQDALGVTLADADATILGAGVGTGELRAAIVQPHQAIERWVAQACSADDARELAANPFFAALGDRLATATDILAAARIAEWLDYDPRLDDLVVDTAPGLAALDLLRAPRQLAALVRGRLVRRLGRARGVLRVFARIGGARLVGDLARFFALSAAPLATMLARVERAQTLLGDADLLLVTSPHDTAAAGAAQIAVALQAEHLAPRAVIVNRIYPADLAGELAGAIGTPVIEYVRAALAAQSRVLAEVASWATPCHALPALSLARRATLVLLGRSLADELERDPLVARRAS